MTAHDRCVHFWLNATNSLDVSAYQHARLVFVRVREYDCSADGQIVD